MTTSPEPTSNDRDDEPKLFKVHLVDSLAPPADEAVATVVRAADHPAAKADDGTPGRPADREVRDQILADALASGMARGLAGRRSGYGERTVRRRLKDPAFQRLLFNAQRNRIAESRNRLPSQLDTCFTALERLRDEAKSESVRLAATKELIAQIDQIEIAGIVKRIEDLEQELDRETRWDPEPIDLGDEDSHDES